METLDMVAVLFLSGVCFGVVEVAKQIGLSSRFAGLVSVLAGIALALIAGFAGQVEGNAGTLVLIGILAGLAAAGLYSAPKAAART